MAVWYSAQMSMASISHVNKLTPYFTPFRRHSLISKRLFSAKMSQQQLTHTLKLPSQPNEPVSVIAAPGLSDSDFRRVIFQLFSVLVYCILLLDTWT